MPRARGEGWWLDDTPPDEIGRWLPLGIANSSSQQVSVKQPAWKRLAKAGISFLVHLGQGSLDRQQLKHD